MRRNKSLGGETVEFIANPRQQPSEGTAGLRCHYPGLAASVSSLERIGGILETSAKTIKAISYKPKVK